MTSSQPQHDRLPVVVLISGNGSNLQALMDRCQHIQIRAVISNRADAHGLTRARQAGIPTQVLSHKHYPDRASYDQALMKLIDGYQPQLVILAGFMRILTPDFVRHYLGHLLNIHPSLLPKFPGLDTHQRALDNAESQHGASVHFVTEELDGGPVIAQASVPVLAADTAQSLAARVHQAEHGLYPVVVDWFAQGRLRLSGAEAELDGQRLDHPLQS